VHGLNLRTRRAALVPAVVAEEAQPAAEGDSEFVMAELQGTSEADSILEDGRNDDSGDAEAETENADADAESEGEGEAEAEAESEGENAGEELHNQFRRFTKPMALLPADPTTLVEVSERVRKDDDESADKGSNPTYILPVDPFNYFPFFNGFSNVNPFSQFYPPPPYLYPQYTNYMHQYANHGVGHPPAYPSPGAYGGHDHGYNFGGVLGGPHGGFPYNNGHPHPHMHYPFGAYKMDVSGPDVRTGSNNPPPFPQFAEVSSTIRPEVIPTDNDVTEDELIAAVEVEARASASAAADDEGDVEIEDDAGAEAEHTSEIEYADGDAEGGSDETTSNVEFEEEDGPQMSSTGVEYI
jgi:hypothetical protein